MKFLVFSDSHNYTNGMDLAIERHKDAKNIIHCGDMVSDVEYLRDVYGTTHAISAVCGNNDYSSSDPYFRIIKYKNNNIYLTHGHIEKVKFSLYNLTSKAKENKCDFCIFGHTHKQLLEESDGLTLLNPGSIGYYRCEYALIDILEDKIDVKLLKI